ncbi:Reverse transcriptase [Theobroma cacao]|nr:Reverse transcriptase [Theobroma cacao]
MGNNHEHILLDHTKQPNIGHIGSRVTEELSLDNTQFTNDHVTVHEEVLGHDRSHGTPPTQDVTTVEIVAPSITQSTGTSPPPPTKRTRKISSTLADYNFVLPPSLTPSQSTPPSANSMIFPLSKHLTYNRFSNTHNAFLEAISIIDEPKTFSQAVKHDHWKDAMAKEILALEENKTWVLTTLPEGKHAIDSKWVYKVKYNPDGSVEHYKAQLVAKVIVRCLLTVVAARNWKLHQFDVNNAFLHGDLAEEVYMKIPQGFARNGEHRVCRLQKSLCRLQKSLYGLRQASRNWYKKFTSSFIAIGYPQSHVDHSLFTSCHGKSLVAVLIYVDDVIITGTNLTRINFLKWYLDDKFHIKDLGKLIYFLGIEVARSPTGIALCQRKYVLDILVESGMMGSKPVAFPMEQHHQLIAGSGKPCEDPGQYWHLVGRLLYLTITRPDISYAVHILSQFMHDPRQPHLKAAYRVLYYLENAPGQSIFLPSDNSLTLRAYCDADWARCPLT